MVPPRSVKKRVLFVCIGNSCRSQMAEAFAKAYGSDVMEVWSAGLRPATGIAPLTRKMLAEKNIAMEEHFPKGLDFVPPQRYDIVVNLSGTKLTYPAKRILEWPVRDPIGQKEEVYQLVIGQIESLVMRLILELRSAAG
jgi:arsenate reductase